MSNQFGVTDAVVIVFLVSSLIWLRILVSRGDTRAPRIVSYFARSIFPVTLGCMMILKRYNALLVIQRLDVELVASPQEPLSNSANLIHQLVNVVKIQNLLSVGVALLAVFLGIDLLLRATKAQGPRVNDGLGSSNP